MIVYEATKELFVRDVMENNIANRVEQLYKLRIGQNINPIYYTIHIHLKED